MAAPNTAVARAYHDIVRKVAQTNLLDNLAKLKKPTGVAAKAAAAGILPKESGPISEPAG